MTPPLAISPEISSAIANGEPVVALESTIITHGMPSPVNLETARAVETDIRDAGCIPATIAVFGGHIHVGLTGEELDWLAGQQDVWKLSRADIAVALVEGATGSTTVAATMISAHLAGIEVFATGGIGGVHRGADRDFDISADLAELAQTPVTVIASGAKAILDLPATLEVLETYGVPVIAFGQDEMPAFWSRNSGLLAPMRLDDPAMIAAAHQMRRRLGLPGGQLIANPIPAGAEIPRDVIDPLVTEALDAAERAGISGKAVTPFLLANVAERSGGMALGANIALVRSNARLAARIARELARHKAE